MSNAWFAEQHIPCICITNRHLVSQDVFLQQIERIAKCRPEAIVLREKDLTAAEYEKLAKSVCQIGAENHVKIILHYFVSVAQKLGVKSIHVPLYVLEQMTEQEKIHFAEIGASTHSVEELKKAEALGATYVFAGHVFATDCKKGVPPRGVEFLKSMCEHTKLPVYALGGIEKENADICIQAGAKGVCMMSGSMKL